MYVDQQRYQPSTDSTIVRVYPEDATAGTA